MRLRLLRLPKADPQLIRQFWTITTPFFKSEVRRKARGMLGLLILLLLFVAGVNVVMSYVRRAFFNVLERKDTGACYYNLWLYLGTFCAAIAPARQAPLPAVQAGGVVALRTDPGPRERPGSLRAQLMYPRKEKYAVDKDLKMILHTVNLDRLLKRVNGDLDTDLDWPNVLSLGEQQRLSFARVLVNEPSIAFLDEATSALDEENETLLYSLLQEGDISFISVGHRTTLRNFHDSVLVLEGEGKWRVEAA